MNTIPNSNIIGGLYPIAESKGSNKKKDYLNEIRKELTPDIINCPECKMMNKPFKESSGFSFVEINKAKFKLFEIKKKKIQLSDRNTCYSENIVILRKLMKKT